MNRKYTDRSRVVTHQRCDRRRFLEYEEGPAGMGIQPARVALPLLVGGAVHCGLASLLTIFQDELLVEDYLKGNARARMSAWEDQAVAAALAEFNRSATAIELDHSEQQAMQPTQAAHAFQQQVVAQARELGMPLDGLGEGVAREQALSEFDRYLRAEQAALVEGLVRAYSRRRLRPLLEQFEVLEVEREGQWKLSEWDKRPTKSEYVCPKCGYTYQSDEYSLGGGPAYCPNDRAELVYHPYDIGGYELWFMSRPDALLRERQSNELYLLSYKTTGAWDTRKARDIEHDMQGLSEGVEVERRLCE
jgi:rubrerythrin